MKVMLTRIITASALLLCMQVAAGRVQPSVETGRAHLTGTSHACSQVPEPATPGLLVAGTFMLHGLRHSV